uniref:Polynucleotide adenylyltransferase n=1 Tax=Meloidogyne floridensis TaxID=298350 RepID=A0A915NVV5_9BILA
MEKIKTKKEILTNIENLEIWEGKECEEEGEQEISFIEQRGFLQEEHLEFVKKKENILLKNIKMKKRMEILIPNFKNIFYFEKSEEFVDNLKIREYFIEIISNTKIDKNKEDELKNYFDLIYSVTTKWMDKLINELTTKKENGASIKNLNLIWKNIKGHLGINLEYFKEDKNKIKIILFKEIGKMFLKIKKEINYLEIPEWINEEMFEENKKSEEINGEIIEKFDGWIDKIVFEELKEQLEKRDAWIGTNKKKGFGMKLKELYVNNDKDTIKKLTFILRSLSRTEGILDILEKGFDGIQKEKQNVEEDLPKLSKEEQEIIAEKSINEIMREIKEDKQDKESYNEKLSELYNLDPTIEGIVLFHSDRHSKIGKLEENFLGKNICNLKEKNECNDLSFYCYICQNIQVTKLVKSLNGWPLIKFEFNGLEVNLNLALVNNEIYSLINSKTNEKIIEETIIKFLKSTKENTTNQMTTKILSDYYFNLTMMSLQSKLGERFKTLIVLLTKWCKNHSIYGENFGFLNDKALTSLAYYLLDKHKNLSLVKILGHFHLIFEKKFELKFEEKVEIHKKKMKEKFEINFSNEHNYPNTKWVILNSEFYKENVLQNLNKSTEKIILRQMKIGSEKLNYLNKEISKESADEIIKQKWLKWLGNDKTFYENLLLIICSHSNDSLKGPQFCDYVESSLKEKLQKEIEKLGDVEYMHINPLKWLDSGNCPEKLKGKNEKLEKSLCTIWVAGLKQKGKKIKEEFRKKLANYQKNLKEDFEEETKEVSNDFVLGFKYLKRNELKNIIPKSGKEKGGDK